MSDAKAVLWYGIFSLSMGGGMLTLYLLLNKFDWIAAYKQGYLTKSVLYTVAGLSWIMVSMFDREMMRGIHSDVVYLTVIGAFGLQWINLYQFIVAYDGAYTKLMFWIGLLVYFCVTVVEQIL